MKFDMSLDFFLRVKNVQVVAMNKTIYYLIDDLYVFDVV